MSAWDTEKTSVQLTRIPRSWSVLMSFTPGSMNGTLTTMFEDHEETSIASFSIWSYSVATTSALMSPLGTSAQILRTVSLHPWRDLAMRVGLVVTPSIIPHSAACLTSSTSPVSTKSFMGGSLSLCWSPYH